jgi:ribosomal protein S18 acetylase RimI-like enzyme
MLIAERLENTKTRRTVRLRPARKTDLPSLAELERAVVADGRGVVQTLDDLQDRQPMERLTQALDVGAGVWLLAEWADEPGKILGGCRLNQHKASLIRHVATLSVEVHPEAQGVGIGRLLVSGALDWARKGASGSDDAVSRVELYVRADNERARSLYESLGFTVEGVRKNFVRLPDGRFVDDLLMGLLIPRA